jgi:DNA (cytosine-5)-methyltransferase 1
MRERPIAVDLFSGAGGLSLGFEQAGFDVTVAVEIDPVHAATHHFNFPECAMIVRSVAGLSAIEIRERAGLRAQQQIDVVFGGAPCQGFSLIGHRALDDPRNTLVREFVRLVSELEATHFVFENVKGLTVGNQRIFLEELISEFEGKGYRVRLPWRVLNAKNYCVPQDRERLFLIGAKKGAILPEYPEPITFSSGGSCQTLFSRVPTCQDALSDLPNPEHFSELWRRDWVRVPEWSALSAYARELRCEDAKAWHFGYPRDWDPCLLTSSMLTEHTDISRRRFAETAPGDTEPVSRFFKLSADGISNTLRAGTDSARGAFTSPRPIHYSQDRCITVREMARLHGFPDWFRFHATKWHGARQIGNSVPPPLARAVARKVLEAMDIKPTRPTRVISLGDPLLLTMRMAEAAEHWKVPVPAGRRDRKSGARKRKQWQVEAERHAESEKVAVHVQIAHRT